MTIDRSIDRQSLDERFFIAQKKAIYIGQKPYEISSDELSYTHKSLWYPGEQRWVFSGK
jgi:hypothetical protein